MLIVAAARVYAAIYSDGSNIPLLAAVALIALVGSSTAPPGRTMGRHR
ncbi:hypothetical protein [Pseudonocardia sp. ICBG601]|nr:hypothetical protein [Pseudonocardia sp. ICBG601]